MKCVRSQFGGKILTWHLPISIHKFFFRCCDEGDTPQKSCFEDFDCFIINLETWCSTQKDAIDNFVEQTRQELIEQEESCKENEWLVLDPTDPIKIKCAEKACTEFPDQVEFHDESSGETTCQTIHDLIACGIGNGKELLPNLYGSGKY